MDHLDLVDLGSWVLEAKRRGQMRSTASSIGAGRHRLIAARLRNFGTAAAAVDSVQINQSKPSISSVKQLGALNRRDACMRSCV